jgi:ABC-type multidrug transport system fused ATPase/permease subunit
VNGTVKYNIIMGEEYDEQKYQDALQYSQLGPDLQILDKKDQTMIGEKGVNIR